MHRLLLAQPPHSANLKVPEGTIRPARYDPQKNRNWLVEDLLTELRAWLRAEGSPHTPIAAKRTCMRTPLQARNVPHTYRPSCRSPTHSVSIAKDEQQLRGLEHLALVANAGDGVAAGAGGAA